MESTTESKVASLLGRLPRRDDSVDYRDFVGFLNFSLPPIIITEFYILNNNNNKKNMSA